MNLLEFSIVYLTCGAPVGVYYFFQQRENSFFQQKPFKLWLKCLLITFFWLPFALKLLLSGIEKRLHKNKFAEINRADSLLNDKFHNFEQSLSKIITKKTTEISIFDFRETFQRYVGLTLENTHKPIFDKNESNDIFQISNHENPKLATICLARRNRLQFERHQTIARKDFLGMLEKLNLESAAKENLSALVFEFANLINDVELTAGLQQIFADSQQTNNSFTVKKMENEKWNPNEYKQFPTPKPNLNLSAISATTMMSKPD